MSRLVVKRESGDDTEYLTRVKELRLQVDSLDEHVIELLGKRMELAKTMGELKRENNISAFQPARWKRVFKSRWDLLTLS